MSVFLRRQHVRQKRAQRNRLRRLEKWLFSVVLVSVGLAALFGIHFLLVSGPFLDVREIIVENQGDRLTPDEVASAAGVEIGDHLFAINMDDVHKRLRANSWIREATVRRRPPHTLWIYVEEYVPAAIVAGKRLVYIDSDGVSFKEVSSHDEKRYPVLTGLAEGPQEYFLTALRLIDWLTSAPFVKDATVAEVHFDKRYGFSLTTAVHPMQITLGKEPFDGCTTRLEDFSPTIMAMGKQIRYIIACDRDRIVVKYGSI